MTEAELIEAVRQALDVPKDDPGLTLEEIRRTFALTHHQAKVYVREALEDGRLVKGTARREDRSGRKQPVTVFRPPEE